MPLKEIKKNASRSFLLSLLLLVPIDLVFAQINQGSGQGSQNSSVANGKYKPSKPPSKGVTMGLPPAIGATGSVDNSCPTCGTVVNSITCTGGRSWNGTACYCPSGTWNGMICEVPPTPTPTPTPVPSGGGGGGGTCAGAGTYLCFGRTSTVDTYYDHLRTPPTPPFISNTLLLGNYPLLHCNWSQADDDVAKAACDSGCSSLVGVATGGQIKITVISVEACFYRR